jgi:hypothetical protein
MVVSSVRALPCDCHDVAGATAYDLGQPLAGKIEPTDIPTPAGMDEHASVLG